MSDVTATGKSFGRKERDLRVRIQWSKPCGFESPFRILLQISVLENWRCGYPPGLGEQRVECGAIQGATVLAPPRGAWFVFRMSASDFASRSTKSASSLAATLSSELSHQGISPVACAGSRTLRIGSMAWISIAAHGPGLLRVHPKLTTRLSPPVGAVKYLFGTANFNVSTGINRLSCAGMPRFQRNGGRSSGRSHGALPAPSGRSHGLACGGSNKFRGSERT